MSEPADSFWLGQRGEFLLNGRKKVSAAEALLNLGELLATFRLL